MHAMPEQAVTKDTLALPICEGSSSWLNLVERWFRDLTDKALRRGVFHSVPDLIAAIETYLQANNDDPKPFVWTASADAILEKVRRGRVALNNVARETEAVPLR